MIKLRNLLLVLCVLHFQIAGEVKLAWALPQGEQVAAGGAQFDRPNEVTLNVTTSDKAIIDYSQFNIDLPETVNFFQPSSSSIVLNRVTGGDPSSILGRLNANGKVFLVNPNGILFGPGSVINAAGFVASVLDIANEDFMNGHYAFNLKPGSENAAVVNQGLIQVAEGGYAGLLAPQVSNQGVVIANRGKVVLASGEKATVDFNGDGLMKFTVSGDLEQALIHHSGSIEAQGGQVLLTVGAAQAVLQNVINQEGIIRAGSMIEDGGTIRLVSAGGGIVSNSGTLDVASQNGKGGTVQVLGDKVGLFDGEINASGAVGGGTVLIGGDRQGLNADIRNASRTYMSETAMIQADALENGNGGKVIVWSNDGTQVYGHISAKGGTSGGNGGFVETSGKGLEITVAPDVSAALGIGGEWLLDPYNIEIVAADDTQTNINGTSPFASTGNSAQLGDNLVLAALQDGASVSIATGSGGSQSGNITWTPDFDFNTIGTGGTLTFTAHNDITINGSFSQTGNDDYLNIVFDADSDSNGGGAIIINDSIATGGGDLTFQDGAYLAANLDTSTSVDGRAGGDITFQGQVLVALNGGLSLTTTGSGAGADGNIDFQSTLNSGNSYTLVNETHTWTNALADAESGDGDDAGDTYLATVTSALENSIVTTTAAGQAGWLGGSDSTTEGDWRWVTGPEGLENSGAGRQFWSGAGSGSGGAAVGGAYSNWNGTAEPNNVGNEDALQLGASVTGAWNDLRTTLTTLNYYVLETNLADTALTITADTGTVTFGGAVGGTKTLGALTINSAGAVNVNAAFANSGAVAITNSGVLTTAAAGDITTSSTFTHSGTGSATMSGDITTTNGAITLNRAVTLGGNVVLNAGTSTITANSTVAAGANTLTLTADEIDLLGGANSVSGSSTLLLQPSTASATTGIGGGAGTLAVDDTDLAALTDGFSAITIGRSDGTGDIEISSSAFRDPVTIRAPSGDGDITISGSITGAAMGSLTLQAGDSITTSGSADISSSSGALDIILNADRDASSAGNITLNSGSVFDSNGGEIILSGGAGTSADLRTTGYAFGISGGDAGSNRGIYTTNAQLLSGAGAITIRGTGASVNGTVNQGVDIVTNSVVQSSSGNITINGVAGNGSAQDNQQGTVIYNGSRVSTTTSGNIDITGTANNSGTGARQVGVDIEDNAIVRADDTGTITITGTGGSSGGGTNNYGISLLSNSYIEGGSSGSITLTATGGNSSPALSMESTTEVGEGALAGTYSGNISLTANSMALGGAAIQTTGTATVLVSTAGTVIDLGNTVDTTAGTLELSGAEIQQFTVGNLIIGDGTNGTITVHGISAANSNNVSGTVTLNATRDNARVIFNSSASTFNTLTANADDGVDVDVAVTTDTGALTFNGDADSAADTNDNIDLAAITLTSAGAMSLTATTGGILLSGANSSTTTLDANGDALLTLGTITDTNNVNLTANSEAGITLAGAANLGSGTYTLTADNDNDSTATLTLNGAITGSSALALSGGGTGTNDDLDVNADVTAGTITIQNFGSVDLAGSVDLNSAGALTANSNVTAINLSGADATTNTITGSGDGAMNLAALTDTNNVHLTVSSQGTLTLAGASSLGTGNYSFTFDSDNDAFTTMTLNGAISGNSALTFQSGGTTTGDAFTISADITGNSIDIHDLDSLLLGTSVDLTANNGDLYAYSNVNTISFQGATGTTNIFDGNGDAFVRLGTFSDNDAPNVTVNSEGDIILVGGVSLGEGNYSFTADNDNDSGGTLTLNGAITGSSVLTLSGGGTGTSDLINLNAAITAGTITIQNMANAALGANLSTDGGNITDSAANSYLTAAVTIDTEQGNDGSAGAVNLGSTVLSGDNPWDLTINTATTAAAQNGGAVSLSTFNAVNGGYINDLSINTSAGAGGTAGTLTLNGSISLDDNSAGDASSLAVTGNGDVVIGSTLTIDTEQNNRDGVAGGSINFASSNIYAGSAGLTLTLNTANSNAGETAGAVTLGLVDDNAGANQFLSNLSVTTVSDTDGAINLGNSVTVNNGNLTLNGDAVLGAAVVLTVGTGTITFGTTSSVAASGNALTMTADEIELNGAASSIGGSGALVLQPSTTSQTIALGGAGGTAALDLTAAEITSLADGFSSITIGRSNGSGNITLNSVTFLDSVTIQTLSGAMNAVTNDTTADVTGTTISLIAASIGVTTPVDYTATAAIHADTSTGNGNIFLDSIGDAPVGYINAGTGNITMNSTGAMDDDAVDKILDFTAGQVMLNATNGIGNNRELELPATTTTTNTTGGTYTATDTDASGTIDVSAGENIVDDNDSGAEDFTSGGNTTLTAGGYMGTNLNPLEVDIDGDLLIAPRGRNGLLAGVFNGTTGDGQIHFLNEPIGFVVFNNKLVGGPSFSTLNSSIGSSQNVDLNQSESIQVADDIIVSPLDNPFDQQSLIFRQNQYQS